MSVVPFSDTSKPQGIEQEEFEREVASRFGLVPNFFRTAPAAPYVTRRLWAFAKSAYLDTPIPTLPLPFTQTFAPNSAQKPEPSLEVIIVGHPFELGMHSAQRSGRARW